MAYSDAERTEALVRLAINNYDYTKTADETGISHQTLRNWDAQFGTVAIPDLLDRAIKKLLAAVPENMPAKEWAIAYGILMDKWLLIQGEPTSRTETNVFSRLGLDDPEFANDIEREMEKILSEAGSGSADPGESANGRPASG